MAERTLRLRPSTEDLEPHRAPRRARRLASNLAGIMSGRGGVEPQLGGDICTPKGGQALQLSRLSAHLAVARVAVARVAPRREWLSDVALDALVVPRLLLERSTQR